MNANGSMESSVPIIDDAAPPTLVNNGASVNPEPSANDDDNSGYPTSAEPYMAYKEEMNFYGKQGVNTLPDDYMDYTKSVKKFK